MSRVKGWYAEQPWLAGANFVPSSASNQFEMWQAETFDPETLDRELSWAAGIGFNTMRVFLHDMVWAADPEGFERRIDQYLSIAAKHSVRTLFVLLDSCWDPRPKLGPQDEPVPGVHNSRWVQSPHIDLQKDPARYDELKAYVTAILTRFKDDARVLGWDLINEPGNPNSDSYQEGWTVAQKREAHLALMKKLFAWARAVNPSQPVTVGVWIDATGRRVHPIDKLAIEQSDIITFHCYGPLPAVRKAVEWLQQAGRPIVCTEYMSRGTGSTFQQILPYLKEMHVGAINWGLVSGRSQTIYPWDSWKNPFKEEPERWFHDVFRNNGTPYDTDETKLIRDLTTTAAPASPQRGVPTPEQIAWHEMEIEMFLCLDPCTWQGREYDDHSTPLDQINPSQLDTNQWCEAAKSFGAKQILFVAKHTGGFCWWPTETTEYCVRNIGWKNGQGDVLGELAESCRRHGLKLGIYIYPGDDQWGAAIGSGGKTSDPAKQEAYNEVLRRQWTEVLSRYGEISELWFDGSCVIELGDIIKQYAPKAMVFQGPYATLRWPGNEQGVAPEPVWQTVRRADAESGVSTGAHSDPDGEVWLPMEMDTTLLDHKWFWGPDTDHMIKPLDKLMDIYFKSVGRGCVLLLNATPDTTGLIPESHMQRYREFGEAIGQLYANKKGATAGAGAALELRFEPPAAVTQVVIKEDIRQGHTVRGYRVEGLADGKWRLLSEGASIGYKRIERFPATTLDALRLRVIESVGTPNIVQFAAYETSHLEAPPQTTAPSQWVPVEDWRRAAPSKRWQRVEVDLTPAIRRPGEYCIEIRRTNGEATLETADATLLIAGVEAARLITPLDQANAWRIRRTDQVTEDEKGRTALRLRVRYRGGATWNGEMFLRGEGFR